MRFPNGSSQYQSKSLGQNLQINQEKQWIFSSPRYPVPKIKEFNWVYVNLDSTVNHEKTPGIPDELLGGLGLSYQLKEFAEKSKKG